MIHGKKEKFNILVADDEEDICQLLKEYMAGMGYEADIAHDGKRTLEYLDSKEYDFVFLDCNMPEVTGVEVARRIKDKKPRPKIVMITGYAPMDEAFAKAVGVDVYLKKPILLGEIKKIIKGENG